MQLNVWNDLAKAKRRWKKKTPKKKHFVAIECYKNLHLHSKIFLSKKNFLIPFPRAFLKDLRNWMKWNAHSGMNLLERHFIAEPVFIVFVHFKA